MKSSREIKFRGKSIDSFIGKVEINEGDWIYGNLIIDKGQAYIVNGVVESTTEYISIEEWCPVDIKTVGQFTGLLDKAGTEIYEGDVVKVDTGNRDTGGIGEIVWFQSGCNFAVIGKLNQPHHHAFPEMCKEGCMYHQLAEIIARHSEIIGNIYENPHLLEAKS